MSDILWSDVNLKNTSYDIEDSYNVTKELASYEPEEPDNMPDELAYAFKVIRVLTKEVRKNEK